MNITDDLEEALERETSSIAKSKLSIAASDLSRRYRSHDRDDFPAFMTSDAHRLAYLAVRMPATYAVVRRVLFEIKQRIPDISVNSILDMGAGPGTATWAAAEVFPELNKASLLEKDEKWLEIGWRLMRHSRQSTLKEATWHLSDLNQATSFGAHDLVIMSYVVGEMKTETLEQLISNGWLSASKVIAIIEPGTPHGFERIKQARNILLKSGAFLVAPCPHAGKCPMEKNDWCHFAERLERSKLHKSVKDVDLGFEDEKFSYIVASKIPVILPEARILRNPQKRSGHIGFTLCTAKGFEERIISRKQGELYKQARKLEWGDVH